MTIYEIKRLHLDAEPSSHFFDRDTLKFFGQTLRMFSVCKDGGDYLVSAPMFNREGRQVGTTRRRFIVATGKLETIREASNA